MKLNKRIVRCLILGVILSSLPTTSYADTKIPNRYQLLEGEHITIDDSMEGNLEEIEIFGNTIQDESNLEDIQSVGDLYVDEDGSPILDKQGREQYKTNILSIGKNKYNHYEFLEKNKFIKGISGNSNEITFDCSLNNDLGNNIYSAGTHIILDKFKPYTQYTISFNAVHSGEFLATMKVNYLDGTTEIIPRSSKVEHTTNGKKSVYNITFTWKTQLKGGFTTWSNIQIEESSSASAYENYKEDKTVIVLPTQLEKIGSIMDKLYWDDSKGRYVVQKNITNIVLDGSDDEDWVLSRGISSDTYDHFRVIPIHLAWMKGSLDMLIHFYKIGFYAQICIGVVVHITL